MRWATAAAILSAALLVVSAVPAFAADGTTYVVQPGETLYRIAHRFGVSVSVLAAYNHISDPTRLSIGQILRLPPTGTRAVQSQKLPPKPAPTQTVTYRYTVSRGDTLALIAGRYGITVQNLMRANGLQSNLIHPGQRLIIPGAKVTVKVPPPGPMVTVKVPTGTSPDTQVTPEQTPATLAVGDTVTVPHPLRLRRGPGTYFTTTALVAPQSQAQVTAESNGWVEVTLPEGDAGWVRREELRGAPVTRAIGKGHATGDAIVREAMQYVGTRYVWGGRSAGGLDCSGLIYIVFSTFAPDLGRGSSYDYFQMGVPVEQAELRPGDLVFFTTYAPGASHVGIYVGERKFIHAASSTQQVMVANLDEMYYVARYIGARRITTPAASGTP